MAEPAAGNTRREEAAAMTVMIVGKSGSGKSTLGNKLLNADSDDDYRPYFTEHGGTAGCSQEITSRTSANGRVRVIDTPGIPDPDKRNTRRYFNTIVEKIRAVDAVNLLVFMVKEDRVDEKQFRDYRSLLKQFNYLPWNKLMVCRQSDYAHRPNEQAKEKKRLEGVTFVNDILEKSGMAMPFMLHLDGTSEASFASVDNIVEYARRSPRVPLGDCPSLQTVEERRIFLDRLLSMKDRASALKEELKRTASAVTYHQRWREVHSTVFNVRKYWFETDGVSLIPAAAAMGMIYVTDAQIRKVQAKSKKTEEELQKEEVDEDLFRETKEEMEDIEGLCGATTA